MITPAASYILTCRTSSRLPTAYCLLLSAFRPLALRRVEELAGLDDVVLFVELAVAVHVHLDLDLVALAIVALADAVGEAVLVAHERVDGLQRRGQLAGEGDGEVGPARLFGEGAQGVSGLEHGHPAGRGRAAEAVFGRQVVAVLFEEQLARADDVDGDAGVLDDLARLVVVDLAEGVNAGGDEEDGLAAVVLDVHHAAVVGARLLAVLQDDGVGAAPDERQLERVEEVGLVRDGLVDEQEVDDLVDARRVVGEVGQGRGAHVVGDDGDVVLRRLDDLLEEGDGRPEHLAHAVRVLAAAAVVGLKLAEAAVFEDERSEEHTSELQSRFGISYAVFCLKKKKTQHVPYYYI